MHVETRIAKEQVLKHTSDDTGDAMGDPLASFCADKCNFEPAFLLEMQTNHELDVQEQRHVCYDVVCAH